MFVISFLDVTDVNYKGLKLIFNTILKGYVLYGTIINIFTASILGLLNIR